jgi:hypothetical protein
MPDFCPGQPFGRVTEGRRNGLNLALRKRLFRHIASPRPRKLASNLREARSHVEPFPRATLPRQTLRHLSGEPPSV